jgi:hypothetical protein
LSSALRGRAAPPGEEARDSGVGGELAADQLQRDLLLVFAVGALGEKHATHAALPKLAHDPPGADARGHGFLARRLDQPLAPADNVSGEIAIGGVEREQALQAHAQRGIVAAEFVEQALALGGRRRR